MLKKALINFLQREVNLADLSYSLTCRRTHHPFRLSVVASDQDELIRRLRGSDFVETQAQADLPPLGFVLRAQISPRTSAQDSSSNRLWAFKNVTTASWQALCPQRSLKKTGRYSYA